MPTTYNLAPVPFWEFRDALGNPLANGYMYAYRDTVRSQQKAVYQDPAGTLIYIQPMRFDAAGTFGPLYWASDENYFLEIYDSSDQLVKVMQHYNAPQDGGVTPITINRDLKNYILDPDFRYNFTSPFSITATETRISQSGWFYRKNNTSATETITFVPFTVGITAPPSNPNKYLEIETTVAGTGELYKDIEFRINNVRAFSGEAISIGYYGKNISGATDIELILRQHFGTGGAPSADVETAIQTDTLGATFALKSKNNQVVPSIGGKTLGTNNDDYLSITLRVANDAVQKNQLTMLHVNSGTTLLPFEYLSNQLSATSLVPPMLGSAGILKNYVFAMNGQGIAEWIPAIDLLPIGTMLMWPKNTAPTTNWRERAGQSLATASFPDLFALIGYTFGGAGANFNLPNDRGLFERGWDNGAGIDPSRVFGSQQADAFKSHTHNLTIPDTTTGINGGGSGALFVYHAPNHVNTTTATGGTETRPINRAYLPIIKVL